MNEARGETNSKQNVSDGVLPQLGEPLDDILNFDSWRQADDLETALARIEAEIGDGLEQEERVNAEIRQRVLPYIQNRPNAPKGAGLYKVRPEQIKWIHSNLLLNGATIAADGTVTAHDTLILTIAQIGICVASYSGTLGEFKRQLFRRDIRLNAGNPVEEMMAVLEARQTRPALGYEDARDELNSLIRRGLMAYGERQALLACGPDKWLMGHGTPAPRELMTVSFRAMLTKSFDLLRELILKHQKFVFVPSEARELLIRTLGDSLGPLQFVIVDSLYDQMNNWIEQSNFSREMGKLAREFVNEVGPKVVRGVYRASANSPAHIFYAHIDHAQEAALIALADSVMQEQRGFPLLLDIADNLCRASFEPGSFRAVVQQSYAKAGYPFRYLTERETRR